MIAYGREPDALDPWRERDDDRTAASPRPGQSPGLLRAAAVLTPLALLVWAGAVALVRGWLS